MRTAAVASCVVALCAPAAPAFAHHSFAMFDNTKTLTLKGVVKEFQWTNPHTWIEVYVKNAAGKTDEWSIEHTSPNVLSRDGWKKTTLRPGDHIAVKINPMKDGHKGGLFISAVFADGKSVAPGG